MRFFLETLKLNLKIYFYYKWNFIIPLLFDPVIVFFYNSLLESIYRNTAGTLLLGYTYTHMIWYFASTKFFYSLVWSFPDTSISESIIRGEMVVRFARPVSIVVFELARATAYKVCSVMLEFIPSFIVFSLIIFPDFLTLPAFLKYGLLTLLAFLLYFFISFLVGTIAFLWKSINSIQTVKILFTCIAAGTFIPIEFYPDILQKIVRLLPFQYLHYIPIQFFLNKPETRAPGCFLETAGIMIIWILLFMMLSGISWSITVKHYSTAGG